MGLSLTPGLLWTLKLFPSQSTYFLHLTTDLLITHICHNSEALTYPTPTFLQSPAYTATLNCLQALSGPAPRLLALGLLCHSFFSGNFFLSSLMIFLPFQLCSHLPRFNVCSFLFPETCLPISYGPKDGCLMIGGEGREELVGHCVRVSFKGSGRWKLLGIQSCWEVAGAGDQEYGTYLMLNSYNALQDWRVHPHCILLFLGVSGAGETWGALELALHVLDDWWSVRSCYGLGHHPPLW